MQHRSTAGLTVGLEGSTDRGRRHRSRMTTACLTPAPCCSTFALFRAARGMWDQHVQGGETVRTIHAKRPFFLEPASFLCVENKTNGGAPPSKLRPLTTSQSPALIVTQKKGSKHQTSQAKPHLIGTAAARRHRQHHGVYVHHCPSFGSSDACRVDAAAAACRRFLGGAFNKGR